MLKDNHFKYISAAAILTFLLIGFANIGDYGMGWDEVTRWESGDLKIAYYETLLGMQEGKALPSMQGDRYPGLFDMTLSLAHRLLGGDRVLQGHALSLLFGALGLGATAWLSAIIFNNRIGFIAVLLLALYPRFYGHAMINPKDIPFMATYVLGLAGVLSIAKAIFKAEHTGIWRFLICGLIIGLAASCRVPGVVLLGFAGFSWLVAANASNASVGFNWSQTKRLIPGLLMTSLATFVVMMVFFPRLHTQLLSGVVQVTHGLHETVHPIPLLFRGQVMDASDAPRLYAHVFFAISTPIWMLMLLGLGLLVAIPSRIFSKESGSIGKRMTGLFMLFSAFPWLYILITAPALHNGIRHMLWAIPPMVIIMATGFHYVSQIIHSRASRLHFAPAIVLIILLLIQALTLHLLHPYQYVFFNRLAGDPATVINRYEGEYWFTSTRHLLESLPETAAELGLASSPRDPHKVLVAGPMDVSRYYIPDGWSLVSSFAEADFYVSNTTFRTDQLAEGQVAREISRNGIPIGIIKKLPQN